MGRWTPLILMAGGLAILLGTLLGINFPMGGQNTAQAPGNGGKTSRVLPANINVNSTAAGTASENNTGSRELQNNTADDTVTETTTAQNTTDSISTTDDTQSNTTNQSNEPIPALW
ncbi:hypothetical protein ACF3DV_06310 [Chlorogloeopsis fritschii PCC 9212]|jgi:hypothetical protein|uniref:Uncharacterized protein n=1 Tax=Chlorogloeopsis fritschii PCC 6912 TaxID=211165 RepID=A0A3S1F7Y9_CHLFR|nr:hypothetical protein [Chlorogloeopsis fritschii]MBF2009693.1 hypothetical protein [Chlorogloeopsis fritschii C42_A2020_084]RUR72663.1 hypothetical protein PCC6912_61290 [Chlorogloeopsis fritschii PCC 6912]